MDQSTTSSFSHLLTYRVLSDIEGYAYLKKKQLGRRMHQYIRIHGAVFSVYANLKSCVSWEVNLLDSEVRPLRKRSFVIQLKSKLSLYVTLAPNTTSDLQQWVDVLTASSKRKLENTYTLGSKIGDGAYATVYKGVVTATGEFIAIKTILKRQFDVTMARELDRELIACISLDIPGIVRIRDVYNMQDKVHIVMDLLDGGTLKDCVQKAGGTVSELVAVPIANQVLGTLVNLHRLGAVHRDVKLENILCDTMSFPMKHALLCDFGYVNFLDPAAETLRSLVGTPVYVAPEIAERKQYGAAVDVYAVGVMLYRMLFGCYPYDGGDDDEKTMQLIVSAKLQFPSPACHNVSDSCKSLIRGLLRKDPRVRLSANGAMFHPWFSILDRSDSILTKSLKQTDVNAKTVVGNTTTKSDKSFPRLPDRDSSPDRVAPKFSKRLSSLHSASFADENATERHGSSFASMRTPSSLLERLRYALCALIFKNRLERAAGLRDALKQPHALAGAYHVHPTKFKPISHKLCDLNRFRQPSSQLMTALSSQKSSSSTLFDLESPVTPSNHPSRADSTDRVPADRNLIQPVQTAVKRAFSFASKPSAKTSAKPSSPTAADRMSPSSRARPPTSMRASSRMSSFRQVKRLLSVNVGNDRTPSHT